MVATVVDVPKGSIQKKTYYFEEAEKEMEYAIYVPTTYEAKMHVPLVVLLHGLFSNPHQIIRYKGLVAEAEKRGYIVVAPFGYNDRGWYGSMAQVPVGGLSEQDVLNVLDIVRNSFDIDDKRIYCMGHSMGGAGALYFGSTYPEIWAALAPMTPALPFKSAHATLHPMRNIPTIAIAAEQDQITPAEPVRRWAGVMDEIGMKHRYLEINGEGHLAPAYRSDVLAQVFDFFDSYARETAAPSSVLQRRTSVGSIPKLATRSRKIWHTVLGTLVTMFQRVELALWSSFYFFKSLARR